MGSSRTGRRSFVAALATSIEKEFSEVGEHVACFGAREGRHAVDPAWIEAEVIETRIIETDFR